MYYDTTHSFDAKHPLKLVQQEQKLIPATEHKVLMTQNSIQYVFYLSSGCRSAVSSTLMPPCPIWSNARMFGVRTASLEVVVINVPWCRTQSDSFLSARCVEWPCCVTLGSKELACNVRDYRDKRRQWLYNSYIKGCVLSIKPEPRSTPLTWVIDWFTVCTEAASRVMLPPRDSH